jgi:hypothetical protein
MESVLARTASAVGAGHHSWQATYHKNSDALALSRPRTPHQCRGRAGGVGEFEIYRACARRGGSCTRFLWWAWIECMITEPHTHHKKH